jgi:hypothetical protein
MKQLERGVTKREQGQSVLGKNMRTFSLFPSLRYFDPALFGTTMSHWYLYFPAVAVCVPCSFHVARSSALKIEAEVPPKHW